MRTQFSKLVSIIALAISAAFAADIPKNCMEEVAVLSKGNSFDVQKFTSDLPPAVAKAKLQAKAPFGKPKDSDKTDIGITFGCLKAFPESPDEIQPLLKNIGLGVAKSTVATNNAGAANSVSASNSPALKECDAVFNPSKKFCYDGGIYDLCDGMSYNPTTHICSGDIANRALCNGTQYNPLKQKCVNNTIIAECGKTTYNPATHGCKDNVVLPICGTATYNPATHGCKDNVVLPICGAATYNPATHGCKNNAVFALSKCGATTYYDPATHGCKDNIVLPICGTDGYDPATQTCKDNTVFSRCGATEFYNPKTHICSYGSVFEK